MPLPKQRIAIIDIGSNTIKVLVADFMAGILLETIHFASDDTRIGGFLGTGSLNMPQTVVDAGVQSVAKLVRLAQSHQPDQIAIVATSAVRDAENGQNFCKQILEATGHQVNLLSGEKEAEAIALGIRCDPAISELKEFYMLDQGGGSLEIIRWSETSTRLVSLPLGAVRLFKKFQNNDSGPVSISHQQQIKQWVAEHCNQVDWLKSITPIPWVGTGGALTLIRTLLAKRQDLSFETSSNQLSYEVLTNFFNEIAALNVSERMSVAGLPDSRADILPAGLMAIIHIMELAGTDSLTHSVYNLRYGYAAKLSLLAK